MEKEQYLDETFSKLLEEYPELESIIISAKEFYIEDKRDLSVIKNEIQLMIKKYHAMENLVNKDIDNEILEESIILIGPMGVGKSTISDELSKENNLERISLDNQKALKEFYEDKDMFLNFKDFEFYLMASVLTSLDKPKIIDFGAGHSIYENPLMFLEFKKLISRFSNVVLLMPCENKEESLRIINERISEKRDNTDIHKLNDNKHFVYSPYNYEVATITEYTNDKNKEEIVKEINEKIENKRRKTYE